MRPRKRLLEARRWQFSRAQEASDDRPGLKLDRDRVVLEEPLHISLKSHHQRLPLATVLRTPGHDYELTLGYLFALGLIQSKAEVIDISYCSSPQDYNRLTVLLRGPIPDRARLLRSPEWVHGGCGLCGQEKLDFASPARVAPLQQALPSQWLLQLPRELRRQQELFYQTGATHAAARGSPEIEIRDLFEDVGRHNAVDKLVGHLLNQRQLPASGQWLLLSGRAGFELLQKAVQAGFSGVASLGPPSSLAIRYAQEAGLCLVGFLSPDRYNLYTHPEPDPKAG